MFNTKKGGRAFYRYVKTEQRLKEQDPSYDYILDQLNAIDSKSSSLLAFNGLLLAALTFLLTDNQYANLNILFISNKYVIASILILVIISSMLNLLCIDIVGPHITNNLLQKGYKHKITWIAFIRTISYRMSLKITALSSIIFSITIIASLLSASIHGSPRIIINKLH